MGRRAPRRRRAIVLQALVAVWVATEWGVFRIADEELTRYEQQLPMVLAVAADGTVWVSHNPVPGTDWISTFPPQGAAGAGQTPRPISDTLGLGPVWLAEKRGVYSLSVPWYTIYQGPISPSHGAWHDEITTTRTA